MLYSGRTIKVKRLENASLTRVPDELPDGAEVYITSFADGRFRVEYRGTQFELPLASADLASLSRRIDSRARMRKAEAKRRSKAVRVSPI